jgi:hypothetical protein
MSPALLRLTGALLLSTTAYGKAVRSVKRQEASLLGFVSQGCFAEPTDARALVGNDYFDDEMTIEKCAASCGGYQYFGAEFGRECWVSIQAFFIVCSFTHE